LLQPEPSPFHIGAEILALRHGIVTGLLLAPAVLLRLAEAGDIALNAVGEDAIAPLVVGAHLLVRRIGVAVAMHREAERQPRRDKSARRAGPAAAAPPSEKLWPRHPGAPPPLRGVWGHPGGGAPPAPPPLAPREEGWAGGGRTPRRVKEGGELFLGKNTPPP